MNPNTLSLVELETEIIGALKEGHWRYMDSNTQIAWFKLQKHFNPMPDVRIWVASDDENYDLRIVKFGNDGELLMDIHFKIKRQSILREWLARLIVRQARKRQQGD